MFEGKTYEVILQSILDRIPSEVDKREGSIIFDAIAPAAAELAQLYMELDYILKETYADTASGEYLSLRCSERGVAREEATHAVVQGVFTPSTVNVEGKRFRCGSHYYNAITDSQLICETAGSEPNGVIGQLIPVEYIDGLETASITRVLIPGEDEETDEELRERYFENLSSQAFGGNVADYKVKTRLIDGVGGVKVTPTWNGGGTVLLTIVASDYTVPSEVLIGKVSETITKIAPIGHVVTVQGAVSKTITISADITYQSGWDWSSSGQYIMDAIDEYFLSLAKEWDDSDNLIVRISGVEQKILSCSGVIDVQNTTLNGSASNLQLNPNEIPIRGDVYGY